MSTQSLQGQDFQTTCQKGLKGDRQCTWFRIWRSDITSYWMSTHWLLFFQARDKHLAPPTIVCVLSQPIRAQLHCSPPIPIVLLLFPNIWVNTGCGGGATVSSNYYHISKQYACCHILFQRQIQQVLHNKHVLSDSLPRAEPKYGKSQT